MTLYGDAERSAYAPPPCPACGSTDVRVEWRSVQTATDMAEGRGRWQLALLTCIPCRSAWESMGQPGVRPPLTSHPTS